MPFNIKLHRHPFFAFLFISLVSISSTPTVLDHRFISLISLTNQTCHFIHCVYLALFEPTAPGTYKDSQRGSNHCARNRHEDIHRRRIVVEQTMSQRVKTGLRKIDKSRNTDYSPIDAAERCKAEDFNRVVTKIEEVCLAS
jgi:hypothetical protein